MALVVLAVLLGVVVFIIGLLSRKGCVILLGAPAAVLLALWFLLASWPPNPKRSLDDLIGSDKRRLASDIRTSKPTFMDGYFISFRMRPSDFDTHVRPLFSGTGFGPPANLLFGQSLPSGWAAEIETATSALHREVQRQGVYLIYYPDSEMAYASVLYEQW
jgi:hypothetical protein